jgi:hypothetical protein
MGRLTGMQKIRQLALMGAAGTVAFRQIHLNYLVFLKPGFQADASPKTILFFWPPERIVLVMDERIT